MHNDQGTTRRNFMKATAAAGALGAISPLWIPTAANASPAKGGHLRLGLAHGANADSLDPGLLENGFEWTLTFAAFNNLTEVAPDGSLVGELAESWEPNADASAWTFNLRKGVQFHDGQTLTAADVIASLNYHLGPDSTSGVGPLISAITDISAPNANTVQITLASGNVDFAATLAGQGFLIKKASDGKIDPLDDNGTGAYKIEKFEPGVVAELIRNENYWKEGRGHFDRVTLLSILDASARTTALQTGQVDAIDGVDLKTVNLLKRVESVKVHSVTGNLHYTFSMHTDTGPFADNNVRMALKYGIDREELVQKILQGYGSPGNDHPVGPAYEFYANDIEQRTYDPDKAAWYLKQSGLGSLEVSLSAADSAFSGAVDAASLYAEKAAAAGIKINVVREPNDGYWSNVWLKKPWAAVFWGGQPTAGAMLELAYAADSGWNDTKWKNARFNELLTASKTELDQAKRKDMFREMQMLIRDDGGAVVPMYSDFVVAAKEEVKFDQLGARLGLDDYRIAERWWFG